MLISKPILFCKFLFVVTSKNSFSMKLAVTHRNRSSLKVANNSIISHFSFLLLLGLAQFHDRKPIFRGDLYKLFKKRE